MRHLTLIAAASLASAVCACDEKPQGEAPSRFAGVTKPAAGASATAFCEKTWDEGKGPRVALPALRQLETEKQSPAERSWRWVNVWATWCAPCVEEMGLLGKWREALAREGLPVAFELLSIDEPDAELALRALLKKKLPGPVKWVRATDDVAPWFEAIGVSRDAAIPIHALFSPDGRLRCVRVGALHAQDYGAVRALIRSTAGAAR
ncbi:MAG: TlpA family protein disulfide reductase [Deltaproteobacteria bacterium]|nr:TlpA family protein disulfide reductase [Deltaproteobacteria bacterium]